MKKIIAIAFAGLTLSAFGASNWGAEEMKNAGSAAFTAFEQKMGSSALDSVTEYRVKMSSQKNSARAYLTYTDGSGVEATEKFFCHAHGADIDCH